eukprot:TRINITY_DN5211_c0_g7_i1.p1 TRINITY_DN5211_c0_g7~~TRINITY_DN5211_c0_g7_i1.p1  ORF type:complete len:291 (+),score=29.90 TRINITY_DN5211_c0_g7_i1:189-1061(+)
MRVRFRRCIHAHMPTHVTCPRHMSAWQHMPRGDYRMPMGSRTPPLLVEPLTWVEVSTTLALPGSLLGVLGGGLGGGKVFDGFEVLDDEGVRPRGAKWRVVSRDPAQVSAARCHDQDGVLVLRYRLLGDPDRWRNWIVLRLDAEERDCHVRDGLCRAGIEVVVVYGGVSEGDTCQSVVELADGFRIRNEVDVVGFGKALKQSSMLLEDFAEALCEVLVVDIVESDVKLLVGLYQVKWIAQGHRPRKRSLALLLAQVADEDVGSKGPSDGVNSRGQVKSSHMLHHLTQIFGE